MDRHRTTGPTVEVGHPARLHSPPGGIRLTITVVPGPKPFGHGRDPRAGCRVHRCRLRSQSRSSTSVPQRVTRAPITPPTGDSLTCSSTATTDSGRSGCAPRSSHRAVVRDDRRSLRRSHECVELRGVTNARIGQHMPRRSNEFRMAHTRLLSNVVLRRGRKPPSASIYQGPRVVGGLRGTGHPGQSTSASLRMPARSTWMGSTRP